MFLSRKEKQLKQNSAGQSIFASRFVPPEYKEVPPPN
jgi:hypothetical protein